MVVWKGKDYTVEVKVGATLDTLRPILVNGEGVPELIDSPEFTGRIAIRIAHFNGITPDGTPPIESSPYFGKTQRLCSIQVQGRFKRDWTANDIMWGNEFDNKLKIPKLAGPALKFIQATIDPSLEADLHSEKPWARSPLIATMNTCYAQNSTDGSEITFDKPISLPDWPSPNGEHIIEDTMLGIPQRNKMDVNERRKHLSKEDTRKEVIVHPYQVWNFDFFNPFLDFANFKIRLPAVKMSINMIKYSNGEPLRYACKSRDHKVTFFLVQFTLLEKQGDQLVPVEYKKDPNEKKDKKDKKDKKEDK
ncbi:hypothetical protein PROFUN_01439 [Planoprotostelium fungivorum]|uniref:Domain of unknown function at the cortex 1 domain-containing protein n=1 Tax=Planoprotostelium fungivorum TaxID=1890364 RepID=A0A2P6NT80_9EUKA|nr:hypothetical protein PROFUN_01439 [Planoprotostelium fungivorum]